MMAKIDSKDSVGLEAVNVVKKYLLNLQTSIKQVLEQEDGQQKFLSDEWKYKEAGGGLTCVLTNGKVIEKAGVNFSHVTGSALPKAATAKRPELAQAPFQALGVSVVVHPLNPFAPTSHFNVRFILVEKPKHSIWWFGGGFDLTPYYGFNEDCVHWHQVAKSACQPYGNDIYPRFKAWADDYFFLPHRNEPRGIGGIFFDDLSEWGFEKCFAFMQSVGSHFTQAYQPILNKRKIMPYSKKERAFQLYRRGRYVEFNLLYDRGTLFGLQSGGRTESILMSMPPLAAWQYDWKPTENSAEADLYNHFLKVRDWT